MRDEVQEAEFVEDDDEPSAPPSAAVPTSQTAPGQTAPRSSKSSESHAEPKIDEESVFAKIDKVFRQLMAQSYNRIWHDVKAKVWHKYHYSA